MGTEPQSAVPSPEQRQNLLKLDGIFMPRARRQRDAIYQNEQDALQKTARFVHYTSAEAALNIIGSKRMWMRNAMCMADYRVVQHGFDILNKFFSDKAKMEAFASALEPCTPGAAQEAIKWFNQQWNAIRYGTFITSVSEHDKTEDSHGRLSMWRAFGGNTARVAFVFNMPWYSSGAVALNLFFSPVEYSTEGEVHANIDEVIRNIKADYDFLRTIDRPMVIAFIFQMLLAGVTCLKHEGFREEREWRGIYCPGFRPSPLMEWKIETIGGVRQVVYKVPIDGRVDPSLADLEFSRTFERLIIGPSPYPWTMFEAFAVALEKVGVKDPGKRISISGIPIRS